jgi:hypothetical protein
MGQDYKWKFFYDSSRHDIKQLITYAEEEITREEISNGTKNDFISLLSDIDDNYKNPTLFFEDKGIVYGLTDNIYFYNKLNHSH